MRRSLMNRGFGSQQGDDVRSYGGHTVAAAAGVAVNRKVTITVTEEVDVKAAAVATAGYHQSSQRGRLQDNHDDEPPQDNHDEEPAEEEHDEEPQQDDHDEEPPQDNHDNDRFQDNRGAGLFQERRGGFMQARSGGFQASGGSFHEQRGGFVQMQQSRTAAFGFSQEHRGVGLRTSRDGYLVDDRVDRTSRGGYLLDDRMDQDQRRDLGLRLRDRFLDDEKNGRLPTRHELRGSSLLKTDKDRTNASRQTRYESLSKSERSEQDKWASAQIRLSGCCPGNYSWHRVPGGYKCKGGGAHLVTDALLSEGNGGYYIKNNRGQHICGGMYIGPVYPGGNSWAIPSQGGGGSGYPLMANGNLRQIEDSKPDDKKSSHKSSSHKSSGRKSKK
jgi:hypothetical protein